MIRKNIKTRIKEYFLLNPSSKLRVRQIEKKLSLPLPSVIRYVKELVNEKILKVVQIENIIFYQADKTSKNYLLEKKIFNLKNIYLSGLIDYLKKEYSNPTIVLFGSFALGEDIEDSDIDLFIKTPTKDIKIPNEYKDKLQRKIQLFIYKDLKEIENKLLINNIINGIILNGYLEVFK